jgi:hypothetical protein
MVRISESSVVDLTGVAGSPLPSVRGAFHSGATVSCGQPVASKGRVQHVVQSPYHAASRCCMAVSFSPHGNAACTVLPGVRSRPRDGTPLMASPRRDFGSVRTLPSGRLHWGGGRLRSWACSTLHIASQGRCQAGPTGGTRTSRRRSTTDRCRRLCPDPRRLAGLPRAVL